MWVSETGVAFGFCASLPGSLESTPEAAPTQRLKGRAPLGVRARTGLPVRLFLQPAGDGHIASIGRASSTDRCALGAQVDEGGLSAVRHDSSIQARELSCTCHLGFFRVQQPSCAHTDVSPLGLRACGDADRILLRGADQPVRPVQGLSPPMLQER